MTTIKGEIDLSGLGNYSPSRPGEHALEKLLDQVYGEISERLTAELQDVFITIENDGQIIKTILFLDSELDPVEIEIPLADLVQEFISDRSTVEGDIPDVDAPSLRALAAHLRDLAQQLEQAVSR
jgi:hypothetical protein